VGFVVLAAIACVALGLVIRWNRERARNAPLRHEIDSQVCYETPLGRVCQLGTGGFGGTRGVWIDVRGPKRLTVGTDVFMISAPQALREFVFTGRESSSALTKMRFGPAGRYWIIISGVASGSHAQLAITARGDLMEVWQALAGTGATI
jgi:hypothetical protein